MNPYVTLLERCGVKVETHSDGKGYCLSTGEGGRLMLPFNTDENGLKAYALEVGAKDAADWMEKHCAWHFPSIIKPLDGGDYLIRRRGHKSAWPIPNLELIRIATKAGWEKGEGL